MSTTADDSPAADQQHSGPAGLLQLPADARRSRTAARAASPRASSLKHGAQPLRERRTQPSPLTPLEEAILIASTSVTGAVMHDGPTQKPDGSPELGHDVPRGRRPRRLQRRQRAGDVVLHDQRRGRVADRAPARAEARSSCSREIPPRWEDRTEDDWLSFANAVKRKVYDGRFAFPEKQWPYFLGWNGQMTNAPGTTQFLPVVDNTRQYINVLLILLSRAARQGAAVHRRLERVPAQERDGVGGLGGVEDRPRRPDPVPADRRPQARPRRLRVARTRRRRWAR